MEKNKLLIRFFCIILAICSFFISVYFSLCKKETIALTPPKSFSIVLDAGHGGIDCGTIGIKTGNKESDLNLDTVFLLKEYLSSSLSVSLTRDNQDGLYGEYSEGFKRRDMQKRKEIIESVNPDIVVSIHMNKFPSPSRRGAQVYYQRGDEKSKELANVVQEMLNTYINIPTQNRSYSANTGDFYICKIKKPTIIIECGFLSNEQDDKLLSQKSYRKKLAYVIYNGIISYLLKSTTFVPNLD